MPIVYSMQQEDWRTRTPTTSLRWRYLRSAKNPSSKLVRMLLVCHSFLSKTISPGRLFNVILMETLWCRIFYTTFSPSLHVFEILCSFFCILEFGRNINFFSFFLILLGDLGLSSQQSIWVLLLFSLYI